MAETSYQIPVLLDAALSEGYQDAFTSASKLAADLKKQSSALEKELNALGKEADSLDKLGESSDKLRKDMGRLEKQIDETRKATDKFGDARKHFRNAKIGAASLKNEIGGLLKTVSKAALGIAAVGTAAALALKPPDELLTFDQELAQLRAISPDVDDAQFDKAKARIIDLSNTYGIATADIAAQQKQLTRSLGFEAAQEIIPVALEFQMATGISVTDLEEELATARVSLGVDTAEETKQFLDLLSTAHRHGIKIDNIDLGDMETLTARVGTDLDSEAFQREFLTTLAFRQVDSFEFADHAQAFNEEFARSTIITPEMDLKEVEEAQENLKTLLRFDLTPDDDILSAMRKFQKLMPDEQAAFREELSPILGEQTVEVIARGSEALPEITQQVDAMMSDANSLAGVSAEILSSWSATWTRIGNIGANTMGILQERFAEAFGPPLLAAAERLFNFVDAHKDQIARFFTGIRDELTPIVLKIWTTIRDAWPDIRAIAVEVWSELSAQWAAIAPIGKQFAEMLWAIVKPIVDFAKEHPKLVATLITGVAAWKAYRLAVGGAQVVYDLVAGGINLVQGHLHKLTATAIGNQRALANTGEAALSTGQKFANMTRNVLATKFPRFAGVIGGIKQIGISALASLPGIAAMGTGLWTALAPLLPVIAVVAAAIGVVAGLAYLVYRNWDVIGPFFSELWGTIKLGAQIAWEFVKFVALSALVGIKSVWEGVTGFFGGIWEGVRGIFLDSPLAPVFQFLFDGVKAVVSPILDFFSGVWSAVTDMAAGAFDWIIAKFKGLNDFLDGIFGWLKGKNRELSDELKGIRAENVIETRPREARDRQNVSDVIAPNIDVQVPEIQTSTETVVKLPSGVAPVFDSPQMNVAAPVVEMPSGVAPVFDSPDVVAPQQLQTASAGIETNKTVITSETVTETMGIPTGAEQVRYQDLRDAQDGTPIDVPTIDTPPSVDVPSSPSAASTGDSEGDRSVSQVNYFTITQQPGEDGDALAKRIAEILKQQMNDAPARFLTQ